MGLAGEKRKKQKREKGILKNECGPYITLHNTNTFWDKIVPRELPQLLFQNTMQKNAFFFLSIKKRKRDRIEKKFRGCTEASLSLAILMDIAFVSAKHQEKVKLLIQALRLTHRRCHLNESTKYPAANNRKCKNKNKKNEKRYFSAHTRTN